MVELLTPIELTPSLEERITVGGDEFIVDAKGANFNGCNIFANIYATRVIKEQIQVPVKERRGRLFKRSVTVGHTTETRETLEPQFDVHMVIAGKYVYNISYSQVLENLRTEIRSKTAKMLNAGADMNAFYAAIQRIHEHYQRQYQASERMTVAVPARF